MKSEIRHARPGNDESAFAERARLNQRRLRASIKDGYDFIVCGSGSSGSVVARRLAENPDVDVLLLEAGGSDDVPEVREAIRWPTNYASERNWSFLGQPSPYLNGRRIPLAMGKVLGGGSSINAMQWAWGHKNDWDFFASEAGDDAWNYQSVLTIYRLKIGTVCPTRIIAEAADLSSFNPHPIPTRLLPQWWKRQILWGFRPFPATTAG